MFAKFHHLQSVQNVSVFGTEFRVAVTQVTDTTELLLQRDAHITSVAEDRRTYLMKAELAKSDPP